MSESRRTQRVEKELRQVIASYLLTGFKEPLDGIVSVTHVSVSRDLRHAKVYVSTLGDPGQLESNVEVLQTRAADFQRQIAKQVAMKFCPKLQFFSDESVQKAMKVERLLKEIESAHNQGEDEH